MSAETKNVLEELVRCEDLPTLPAVIHQAMALLADERSSLREVGELVATDPVLGGRVLRLVNSALVALRSPMRSIPDAVVYLGSDQMRNLLLSSSVVDAFGDPGVNLEPYWEHAFGCGYVASRLSRLLGQGSADDAYLGGLFHDLGRIVLVTRFLPDYLACLEYARTEARCLSEIERTRFGVDHSEIGAAVAREWGFAESLVAVTRHHHRPRQAEGCEPLAALVGLADYLCWSRGLIDVPEDLKPADLEEEDCWQILAESAAPGSEPDPHSLLHEADTMVHTARILVRALYTPPGCAPPANRPPVV